MSSAASIANNTKEFTIPAGGGLLAAVLHTSAGRKSGITVIICHGFRGSKEGGGRAAALAVEMACRGFAALRFDFTPLGRLSSQVDELRAVVDYCRAKLGSRLVLLGRSMGGSAALAVTAADRSIAGLCLWSTPCDLHEAFRISLGEGYARLAGGETLDLADEFGHLRLTPAFLGDFDRFDLLADAGRLAGRPLLVIHGEKDEIVPLKQAEKISDHAAGPKKLIVIPGGDHRFLTGYGQASAAVLSWLTSTFTPAGD